MRKILFAISLITLGSLISCKKDTFDPGATVGKVVANGWWVNVQIGGANQTSTPTFLSTYNTSSNTTDSMWVDDLKNYYGFKCKVATNYSNYTFSTTNSQNAYYVGTVNFPATVTITNGKIFPKAGHSLNGNVTDSIYMQVKFSDDPSTTYTIVGTARTGFAEDDYY